MQKQPNTSYKGIDDLPLALSIDDLMSVLKIGRSTAYDLVRTGKYEQMVGVDKRYTVLPIPSRELTLNKELKQHPLWVAVSETEEEQ